MKCPWLSKIWKFPAHAEHEWVKTQISLHFANWNIWTHIVNVDMEVLKSSIFIPKNPIVWLAIFQCNWILFIHLMCVSEVDTIRKGFYHSQMKLIFKWKLFKRKSICFILFHSFHTHQPKLCIIEHTVRVWIWLRAESHLHSTKWASSPYTPSIFRVNFWFTFVRDEYSRVAQTRTHQLWQLVPTKNCVDYI